MLHKVDAVAVIRIGNNPGNKIIATISVSLLKGSQFTFVPHKQTAFTPSDILAIKFISDMTNCMENDFCCRKGTVKRRVLYDNLIRSGLWYIYLQLIVSLLAVSEFSIFLTFGRGLEIFYWLA